MRRCELLAQLLPPLISSPCRYLSVITVVRCSSVRIPDRRERPAFVATRHSFPMGIIIWRALDWRCETRPPPLSRPVPKPVLGSPLSTPTPSWRPPSPPRQLSLPSARDARPPVLPCVRARRPLFLLSLVSVVVVSPVLWERGGVGAHGRALRGGDAGERASAPLDRVSCHRRRCGHCMRDTMWAVCSNLRFLGPNLPSRLLLQRSLWVQ